MLLLGSKTLTIDGITVFFDHADPSQFWYLPGPPRLGRRALDQRAAFTFIKYKPAAVAGGARGGGFVTFEVNLRLDPEQERRALVGAEHRPADAVADAEQLVGVAADRGGDHAASPAGDALACSDSLRGGILDVRSPCGVSE